MHVVRAVPRLSGAAPKEDVSGALGGDPQAAPTRGRDGSPHRRLRAAGATMVMTRRRKQ